MNAAAQEPPGARAREDDDARDLRQLEQERAHWREDRDRGLFDPEKPGRARDGRFDRNCFLAAGAGDDGRLIERLAAGGSGLAVFEIRPGIFTWGSDEHRGVGADQVADRASTLRGGEAQVGDIPNDARAGGGVAEGATGA